MGMGDDVTPSWHEYVMSQVQGGGVTQKGGSLMSQVQGKRCHG